MRRVILTALSCAFGVGCGKQSSTPTDVKSTDSVLDITGTWQSPTKDPLTFTSQMTFHSEGIIDDHDLAGKSTFGGTFAVGDVASGGARALDLVAETYGLILTTATAVSVANEQKYCGFSDWSLNVEKKINGRVCDYTYGDGSGTMSETPPGGEKIYTIYKIEGETLWVGEGDEDGHEGKSPETRHNKLASDSWTKQ